MNVLTLRVERCRKAADPARLATQVRKRLPQSWRWTGNRRVCEKPATTTVAAIRTV